MRNFFEKIAARMTSFEARVDNKLADMMGRTEDDDARIKQEMSKNFQKHSSEFNNAKSEVDKQIINTSTATEIKDLSHKMKELIEGQDQSWNGVLNDRLINLLQQ